VEKEQFLVHLSEERREFEGSKKTLLNTAMGLSNINLRRDW
jgi:hypothetical protein